MSAQAAGDYQTLPLLPLRDVVIFPGMMMPFVVGRERSIHALERAIEGGKKIFLSAQRDAEQEDPTGDAIYPTGTVSTIVQSLKRPDGTIKVLVEGVHRARIIEHTDEADFVEVVVRPIEPSDPAEQYPEKSDRLSRDFERFVKLSANLPNEAVLAAVKKDNVARLADTIAAHLPVDVSTKQKLLETVDVEARLDKLIQLIGFEIEKARTDKRIQGKVKKQMEKAQREYYLNEKIKAIQKELGRDGQDTEAERLRTSVADARMPRAAREKAEQELDRLDAMPAMSAEATVSRNYVEWLVSVPWYRRTRENADLELAGQILRQDHHGLDEIKDRIIEFLAVRQLVENMKGSILCFVGAPGTGKSSLAKSIARATSREFVRLSLGGVRDEAEVRGHRRTYIGAFPGQIMQRMKQAGVVNPVFLLDEVDKMSADFRGDPSSALMEVLDPEQNISFVDHYLDADYDLSHVMFICTANVLHTIPAPLQDRMEIIRLSGYTHREKVEIARRHLLPKQIGNHGLRENHVTVGDEALGGLIESYTREAGVRTLEREIARVCRKAAHELVLRYHSEIADATEEAQKAEKERILAGHADEEEEATDVIAPDEMADDVDADDDLLEDVTDGLGDDLTDDVDVFDTDDDGFEEAEAVDDDKTDGDDEPDDVFVEARDPVARGAPVRSVAAQAIPDDAHITVDPAKLEEYLGVPRFKKKVKEERDEVGVAAGLAWTERGGEILTVEATLMSGKGKLALTGKLGETMQESGQAALSYVRSQADRLGIDSDFHTKTDIHVHVPEGAIPKDGPSAGITLATAIFSALARIPVRNDVAMTGEITLRGKVLPIGGLKEKVLAAHRAGMRTLVLPADNEKDLKDIPEDVRDEISIHLVDRMDQVLEHALVSPLKAGGEDVDGLPREDTEGDQATSSVAH